MTPRHATECAQALQWVLPTLRKEHHRQWICLLPVRSELKLLEFDQETVPHLLSSCLKPSSSSGRCKQSSSPAFLSRNSIRRGRTSFCLSQMGCWPFKALELHQQLVPPLVTSGSASQPCLAYWQHRAASCGPACHADAMNAWWELLQMR